MTETYSTKPKFQTLQGIAVFTPNDVNLGRVQKQLETLAKIGGLPSGGMTRYTFSEAHLEATHVVADWMRAIGLDVGFDQWGNLLGRTISDGDLVMSGSHLDSVPNGGNFDGVLGVVAGLEALTLIRERGAATNKSLGVVSFIEEEGARFQGLLGSTLAVGGLNDTAIDTIADADGNRFVDVLANCNLPDSPAEINFQENIAAFLELHIEQGKRLERAKVPIGVVTSIAGPTFMRVTLEGQSDHAGATAYEDRRDALLAAAEIIVRVRELAVNEFAGRGHMTVGKIDVRPNVTNVVAGRTVFNIDFRAADEESYTAMSEQIAGLLQAVAEKHAINYESEILHHTPAVMSVPRIRTAIEAGANTAGVKHQPLVSWAAHDAMNMATVADTGMIFVPCRDGRSHTPEEYVAPNDIAAGIAVLANALFALAN